MIFFLIINFELVVSKMQNMKLWAKRMQLFVGE